VEIVRITSIMARYLLGGVITGVSSGIALILPQAFKEIGVLQELRT
jgi:hypothetical protein